MSKEKDYYQVSLPREIQTRLSLLFERYPEIAIEYKKRNNPGYVKFIEEAVRYYIRHKEEFEIEKIRYTGKNKIKKELGEALDDHSPQSKG